MIFVFDDFDCGTCDSGGEGGGGLYIESGLYMESWLYIEGGLYIDGL